MLGTAAAITSALPVRTAINIMIFSSLNGLNPGLGTPIRMHPG